MTVLKKVLIVFSLLFILLPVQRIQADSYTVIIDDSEDLLSEEEEKLLYQQMLAITEYGNCAFASVRQYGQNTDTYAKNLYRSYFGTQSGTLFLIDMGQRNIWIFSDGAIYRTINKAYANTITDNVYRYASLGSYYHCASEAFSEMLILLEGGRIAQPMKYISNVLIALVSALLLNFFFLILQRKKNNSFATAAEKMTAAAGVYVLSRQLTKSSKHRHVESSGGGSSGGGGFSGGGGGGGSSGGGGGHSF